METDDLKLDKLYRPIWTCGRYDERSKTAIYFNLLSGLSFLFEGNSALVLGYILSVKKGESCSLESISTQTCIPEDAVSPFIFQLVSNGLLSLKPMTKDVVDKYRKTLMEKRKNGNIDVASETTNDNESVEKSYARLTNSRVVTVMFELTYNCSEKCVHCYNPGAVRNDKEINLRDKYNALHWSDYKRIIDELYDEGLVKVCLSGGDPFSSNYAWEIIDYLYKRDIVFEIYTNGLKLYGQEERLAGYFPCNVGVSIYSDKPEIHDAVTRVKGSFYKSVNVIERLFSLSVPLEIKCCLMKINVKHYLGVADIAKQFAAVFQLECAIFNSIDGDACVSRYLRLSEEQMSIVLRDKNNPLYVGSEVSDYGARTMDLSENGCGAGFQNFCITPSGHLVLCCNFHAKLGDLTKQHLPEILDDNSTLKFWKSISLLQYEDCWKHDYCKFCKFCPGLNFTENGTPLKASENSCYVAKIRYNLAQRLLLGDDPLNGKSLIDAVNDLPDSKLEALHRIPTESHLDKNIC